MVSPRLAPKRDATATRGRILAAATRRFAEQGYSSTGIREVAEEARVSLPLLSRYFGSKAGLFEAVLRAALASTSYLDTPRGRFGETLTGLITQSRVSEIPTAISVMAASDPEARPIATRVVEGLVVAPLARWLGQPDAHRRAVAITMLGSGLVTHLHLLPIMGEAQAVGPNDPLVRWFADAIQRVVDGTDDWEA